MDTLTFEVPEKVSKILTDLVEELGGKLVISNTKKKSAKKQQVLNDLEESVKWVKLHQEGKVKSKTIEQLLDEL